MRVKVRCERGVIRADRTGRARRWRPPTYKSSLHCSLQAGMVSQSGHRSVEQSPSWDRLETLPNLHWTAPLHTHTHHHHHHHHWLIDHHHYPCLRSRLPREAHRNLDTFWVIWRLGEGTDTQTTVEQPTYLLTYLFTWRGYAYMCRTSDVTCSVARWTCAEELTCVLLRITWLDFDQSRRTMLVSHTTS